MDIRRLVRPASDWATITTLLDLDDGAGYQTIRDTWTVTPPPRKPQLAVSERRYGGARTVGETHDNGTLAWTTLVTGATANEALDRMDALLAVLEQATPGVYLEWRPDGATQSGYHEVRGPAVWKPNYTWAQFAGAHSLTCEVQIPVAPLVRGAPIILGPYTVDLPTVIELDQAIPGDAPALMDVKLTPLDDLFTAPPEPAWVMVGWTQRQTPASIGVSPAPFGILVDPSGYEVNPGDFTADYVYGSWRGPGYVTPTGPGSYTSTVLVDPFRVPDDAFADGELTVELWGRFEVSSNLVNPRVIARCGGLYGNLALRPTLEFGEAGRQLVKPSSGTSFRFTRLGTLVFTERLAQIVVDTVWDGSSGGPVGLDYLIAVPVAQRALGATGKPLDGTYPSFFPVGGVGSTVVYGAKIVLSDLSGYYYVENDTGQTQFPATTRHVGLGGVPLEIPPGDVDLLVKASLLVPDDPTSDTTTEQGVHANVEVCVRVTPRWFLARGSG